MEVAVSKQVEPQKRQLMIYFFTAKAAELSLFAIPSIWGLHCNLESMVIPRNAVKSTGSTGSPFESTSALITFVLGVLKIIHLVFLLFNSKLLTLNQCTTFERILFTSSRRRRQYRIGRKLLGSGVLSDLNIGI